MYIYNIFNVFLIKKYLKKNIVHHISKNTFNYG
jgi:hypothetical protein